MKERGAEEKKSNFVWKHFQSLISKEGGWEGGLNRWCIILPGIFKSEGVHIVSFLQNEKWEGRQYLGT